jgi:hypothetical protein
VVKTASAAGIFPSFDRNLNRGIMSVESFFWSLIAHIRPYLILPVRNGFIGSYRPVFVLSGPFLSLLARLSNRARHLLTFAPAAASLGTAVTRPDGDKL